MKRGHKGALIGLIIALLLVLAIVGYDIFVFVGGGSASSPRKDRKHGRDEREDDDDRDGGYDDRDDMGIIPGEEKLIGISLPTKDLSRWNEDGRRMQSQLEELGYKVNLKYANNVVSDQASQIQDMIDEGCDLLIIAAIDADSLGTVLEDANAKDIPVIAYDIMIRNTGAISYYVTFDSYQTGVLQAQYIIDAYDLDNSSDCFTMEIFAGDPDDANALMIYNGAMDTLRPYIDAGKIIIPSGQVNFADVATGEWRSVMAQNRMDSLISRYYADGTNLDICLCSNDSMAYGVTMSLQGYYPGEWPIVTGQDCDVLNVKSMISGTQTMSVFKDPTIMRDATINIVCDVLNGRDPVVNDTETYNNGVITIPTYGCTGLVCTVNNYQELLIESGYYSEDMLN